MDADPKTVRRHPCSTALIGGQTSSSLLLLPRYSKLIVVIIVVHSLFFNEVEFDGIEADNFQLHAALFTIDNLAFIRFDVDMDIAFTFGTRSGRHF
jgi:hypothetical protein